jgi:hypothetical protein
MHNGKPLKVERIANPPEAIKIFIDALPVKAGRHYMLCFVKKTKVSRLKTSIF